MRIFMLVKKCLKKNYTTEVENKATSVVQQQGDVVCKDSDCPTDVELKNAVICGGSFCNPTDTQHVIRVSGDIRIEHHDVVKIYNYLIF